MHILAIESSSTGGSVAALEDDSLLVEIMLDEKRRTAQTLSPAMSDILQQVKWAPRDVNLVAVTLGPGSFTGLRIGVTAAKTFAYATQADVIGVGTHDILAAQVPGSPKTLWTILNAERQQLFAASFRWSNEMWMEKTPPQIVDLDPWIRGLTSHDLINGPPLQKIADRIPSDTEVVSSELWLPRAATVGRVAMRLYRAGIRHDVWSLLPQYFRESAAVEKAQGS